MVVTAGTRPDSSAAGRGARQPRCAANAGQAPVPCGADSKQRVRPARQRNPPPPTPRPPPHPAAVAYQGWQTGRTPPPPRAQTPASWGRRPPCAAPGPACWEGASRAVRAQPGVDVVGSVKGSGKVQAGAGAWGSRCEPRQHPGRHRTHAPCSPPAINCVAAIHQGAGCCDGLVRERRVLQQARRHAERSVGGARELWQGTKGHRTPAVRMLACSPRHRATCGEDWSHTRGRRVRFHGHRHINASHWHARRWTLGYTVAPINPGGLRRGCCRVAGAAGDQVAASPLGAALWLRERNIAAACTFQLLVGPVPCSTSRPRGTVNRGGATQRALLPDASANEIQVTHGQTRPPPVRSTTRWTWVQSGLIDVAPAQQRLQVVGVRRRACHGGAGGCMIGASHCEGPIGRYCYPVVGVMW